ncbi:MAG TPA: SDR family oxidoreductase [Longimicrobium sp.]|nr:SDR family oxidoreductase [Longimicrobium sp.]
MAADPISGKVVLVTGPARGIGEETARQLAARGARLSLVGMEPARLEALAAELGPGHAWFECDVTDQAALDRAVAGTVRHFGGIDVVIANAGIASNGTVAVTPADALVRVLEVNLIGLVRTVSATLPHVTERRGYFLLVSSASALAPLPGMSTYAASKIGVEHFGAVLRLEVAHKGVAVGVAHPAWIDTDLVRDTRRDLKSFERTLGKLPGPFGTVTTVQECAAAFVDGIAKRRRKIYVPRSLAPLAGIRQIFWSSLSDRAMARQLARRVPEMEAEVRALGRSFGEHSVGPQVGTETSHQNATANADGA